MNSLDKIVTFCKESNQNIDIHLHFDAEQNNWKITFLIDDNVIMIKHCSSLQQDFCEQCLHEMLVLIGKYEPEEEKEDEEHTNKMEEDHIDHDIKEEQQQNEPVAQKSSLSPRLQPGSLISL